MLISIAQFQLFFLALTRVIATIIHVPPLGGNLIPTQVRIGLGFTLAMILIPWQPLPATAPITDLFVFAIAIGRGIVIGTLAGFASALTFAVFQIAGEMMGTSSGFGAGRILNPVMGDTGSAFDQLFLMTCFLVFLVINGHHTFIIALQDTFKLIPVNSPLPELTVDRLLVLAAQLFTYGIRMALPIMGTLLLTDIGFGLMARVAPQVQVFFLETPLKIGAGFIAMSIVLGILFPAIRELFQRIGPQMLSLLGG